jgi:hypothetical protein
MASRIRDLANRIADLEQELESEIADGRTQWRYRIDDGRIRFEKAAQVMHKHLRQRLAIFLLDSDPLTVITAPLLYIGIVPIAVLDAWVSVYQHTCFRVYGIARVRRAKYVVFDRQHLRYLNGIEKLNCAYCSYATGVFAYVREVAGRTEEYWCPIRHAQHLRGAHAHYREFVHYGDAEGYQKRLPILREQLRKEKSE